MMMEESKTYPSGRFQVIPVEEEEEEEQATLVRGTWKQAAAGGKVDHRGSGGGGNSSNHNIVMSAEYSPRSSMDEGGSRLRFRSNRHFEIPTCMERIRCLVDLVSFKCLMFICLVMLNVLLFMISAKIDTMNQLAKNTTIAPMSTTTTMTPTTINNKDNKTHSEQDTDKTELDELQIYLSSYQSSALNGMIGAFWDPIENNPTSKQQPSMLLLLIPMQLVLTASLNNQEYENEKLIPEFIIDVIVTSGGIQEGAQSSIYHMPALETDYNTFVFSLSPNHRDVDLKKVQHNVRSKEPQYLRATSYGDWTGWQTTLQTVFFGTASKSDQEKYSYLKPLQHISESYLSNGKFLVVDATKLLVNRFFVIESPPKYEPLTEITDLRISKVTTFPRNTNFFIQVQQGYGTRAIEFSYTFGISLLPKKPMPMRLANDRIGYFTTDFTVVGEVSTEKSPLSSNNMIHIINRRRLDTLPIKYYIDPSVPLEWRNAIKIGVENWNLAFEKAGYPSGGGSLTIQAILPGDKEFPADYDAGDIRFSTISWSLVLDNNFALGPSTIDPRSGEILNSDIVISHGWVSSWFNDLQYYRPRSVPLSEDRNLKSYLVNRLLKQQRRGGGNTHYHHGCMNKHLERFQLDASILRILGAAQLDNALLKQVVELGLTYVVMHEVGHTLGLRHNFKGSLSTPFESLQDPSYVLSNGLTRSVMDYLPINLPSDEDLATIDIKTLFTSKVGDYDIAAIGYGYRKVSSTNKTSSTADKKKNDGFQNLEGFDDPELEKLAESAGSFGTDEDNPGFSGPDPETTVFDLSDEPLYYFVDQLRLVSIMQRSLEDSTTETKHFDGYAKRQISFIHRIGYFAQAIAKFIGGIRSEKISFDKKKKTIKPVQAVDAKIQTVALDILLDIIEEKAIIKIPALSLTKQEIVVQQLFPLKERNFSEILLTRSGICEGGGIHQYCLGSNSLNIEQEISEMKKVVLSSLLDPEKLKRLDHSRFIGFNSSTVLERVTALLFGHPMVLFRHEEKPKESLEEFLKNLDKAGTIVWDPSKQMKDRKLWPLQAHYVDHLNKMTTTRFPLPHVEEGEEKLGEEGAAQENISDSLLAIYLSEAIHVYKNLELYLSTSVMKIHAEDSSSSEKIDLDIRNSQRNPVAAHVFELFRKLKSDSLALL